MHFLLKIFLTVVYFLVICPVAWMLRLCGRDPMKKQFDKNATTYWS